MFKKFFLLLVPLFVGLALLLICKKDPHFSVHKIRSSLSYSAECAVEAPSEEERQRLHALFSQPLTYLGAGAQCYAFLSADKNYVIKFFKMKHLLPKKWLLYFPFPWLEEYRFRKVDQRIQRQKELFLSYKMAYQNLKEETGVLFVHLNKTKDLGIYATLLDKNQVRYEIPLDAFEFVVQRKAEPFRKQIAQFMQEGNRAGAKAALSALLQHIVSQCKRGFVDRDSGVSHNYGFIQMQVMHFDVGRLTRDENAKTPDFYQRELLRASRKLALWLSEFYPELLADLEECTAQLQAD